MKANLPDWLPEEIQQVAKAIAAKKERDDYEEIKWRLLFDPRMKLLWQHYGRLSAGERTEKMISFLDDASLLRFEARDMHFPSKEKARVASLKKKTARATSVLLSVIQDASSFVGMIELDKNKLIRRLEYLNRKVVEALDDHKKKGFQYMLHGDAYAKIGEFSKRGAETSEDIYITRALRVRFREDFGNPLDRLAGAVSLVMLGLAQDNISASQLRDRVRKRSK